MRPYWLYSSDKNELSVLSSVMVFLMRKSGVGQLPECVQRLSQLEKCLDDPTQLRMMVCDVTAAGVLPILEQARSRNRELKLVLVADGTVPPVRYIRPSILPTALLWRPLQQRDVRDTLWEVLCTIPKADREDSDDQTVFCLEIRGDVRRVPHQEILCFEAKNKRLELHLLRRTITFSGTLEKLAEQLPDRFIRVHKSFIINRDAISEIQFGQNMIYLEGGITVPISRSYKASLKAVFS